MLLVVLPRVYTCHLIYDLLITVVFTAAVCGCQVALLITLGFREQGGGWLSRCSLARTQVSRHASALMRRWQCWWIVTRLGTINDGRTYSGGIKWPWDNYRHSALLNGWHVGLREFLHDIVGHLGTAISQAQRIPCAKKLTSNRIEIELLFEKSNQNRFKVIKQNRNITKQDGKYLFLSSSTVTATQMSCQLGHHEAAGQWFHL